VATANEGHAIHLWEASTGLERRALRGHLGPVVCLAFSPDGRLLASGSEDQTVLLWRRAAPPGGVLKDPTTEQLQRFWSELGIKDARKAYDAVCGLAAAPEKSLPFLRQRLEPLPKVDPKEVRRMIDALDAKSFKARERAMDRLTLLGRLAEESLRQSLKDRPTLEVRRRVEVLLKRISDAGPTDEWRRVARAVEALELIGGSEARRVLAKLAEGAEAPPTRAARAALERLTRRQQSKP
jgi:WD40 domain-containing protein